MKQFFILIIFSFLFSQISYSQVNYTWDSYGISFNLTEDFRVSVNSGEEFSANSPQMYFTIVPFYDESIDDLDITDYTISLAEILNMQEYHDFALIDLNGLEGGYLEGYLEGSRIYLMGIIDPNTDSNFFVIITFVETSDYAFQVARYILTSMYGY